MKTENPEALENKTVRLSTDQLAGLQAEAARIKKDTKMECGWSTVVRLAVDDFLKRRRKAAVR